MKSRTPWKATPKPRKSRAVKGSDLMTYNLVKVPRKLLEDARAKCEREIPRLTLTSQIVKLLMEWLAKDPMMGNHQASDPAPRMPRKPLEPRQDAPRTTNEQPPDLF